MGAVEDAQPLDDRVGQPAASGAGGSLRRVAGAGRSAIGRLVGLLENDSPAPLLGFSACLLATVAVLGWVVLFGPLGWILPKSLDGTAVFKLPAPAAITEIERAELRKLQPEFENGLPAAPVRTWSPADLPSHGMFYLHPASAPRMRDAISRIRSAADVVAEHQTAAADDLQEAGRDLKAVEKVEGKDRAAVLYHEGLVLLLGDDPQAAAEKPLKRALDIIDRDLPGNTDPASPARAAGVRAAMNFALGEVEMRKRDFPAAETAFDAAIASADAARSWSDARTKLYTLQPARTLVDYDSSQFLSERLLAAQHAGDTGALSSELSDLSNQAHADWQGRTRLAVTAQLVAADRGLWNAAAGITPQWSKDDPPEWQALSDDARYIAGAGDGARVPDALREWDDIHQARAAFNSLSSLNDIKERLGRAAFQGKTPLAQHWRDEVAETLGRDLLKNGLDGSQLKADAFIMKAGDVFPGAEAWEAAGRYAAYGAPSWLRILIVLAALGIAGYGVLWLLGARHAYRLTFSPLHNRDRMRKA